MKFANTKNKTLGIVSFLTIAVMVASPVFAFAKENGKGNHGEEKRTDKQEKKADKSCVRAFGHLIAPSWIKHNGQVDFSAECALPSGIANIFWHHRDGGNSTSTATSTATTTPDTTSPVISNLTAVRTGTNRARISWTTNELTNGKVWLSTTTPVNSSSTPAVTQNSRAFWHSVVLDNITASTTYYIVVSSSDAAGNTSTSSEISFSTKATSTPVVVVPLEISNAVATVGTSSVTATWLTNVNADSQVYYSTSSPVTIGASSTQAVINPSLVTNHSVSVTGLATSTTYFMLIRSKDAANNVKSTGQFSVTTGI